MSIEAMKQLIEDVISMMEYHIEQTRPIHTTTVALQAAKDALKAIAEAEKQEPVAWITGGGNGELWWHQSSKFDEEGNLIGDNPDDIPLYTHPPQRQPLTDEAIWRTYKHLWMFHPAEEPRLAGDILKFARAIEAAHGIKGEA